LIPNDAFGGASVPTGNRTSPATAIPGTKELSVVSARIPPTPTLVRPSDLGAVLSLGWMRSTGRRNSMSVRDAIP
jgi:hypothetical protein